MDEIAFAVLAATVATIAVFVPLAFLSDKTGRLFREFGLTVAMAVALSGFVALTLSPMLCGRILRRREEERGLRRRLGRAFDALSNGYGKILAPLLRHRLLTLGVGLAWVGLGVFLFGKVGREFVPDSDRGSILTFTRAPEGSTMEYTDRYQRAVEEVFLSTPEIRQAFSIVGLGIGTPGLVNEGALFTTLTPQEERTRSQMAVVDALRMQLFGNPGIEAFPINPSPLRQSFASAPVSLVVQGPNVERLAEYADAIAVRAAAIPGLVNLRSDLLLNKPQIEVSIDRNRASDLGVSVREIATALQVLFGGRDLTTFKLRGETYDVIAQLDRRERSKPSDLYSVYVRGSEGRLIPLASVVEVRETVAPRGLPHFDRLRAATVTGYLMQGAPLGAALSALREVANEVVPEGRGYRVAFSGESEDFFESGNALLFAYILAVVIIYLVLAAQFESFLHPLTILVAVALSFTGALVALVATGGTLNLYSEIGLVMLVGLVTKNSILIVEFANQLRERGADLVTATFEAARTRFRPILMTALSTIVGILPIALGGGAGGEARAPLGVAVVGGMAFSTLLTFFVVPAAYVVIEQARARVVGERTLQAEESPSPA
jgi:multidrug efflux pump